jgi:hypothetical protein
MEASQPRVKPTRTAELEQNLVRQAPGAAAASEANVVELPPRPSAEPPPLQRQSQAPKPQNPKPKSQTRSTSQRQPMMKIRQRWVGHQQLLASEMQQLEAQAERINQRLAERFAGSPESSHPQSAPPLEDEEADRLRDQLARIHGLLADLDTTIAEGNSLVAKDSVERIAPAAAIAGSEAPEPIAAPAEGDAVRVNPPLAGLGTQNPADQAAAQMAATLRELAEKARSTPPPLPTPEGQPNRKLMQFSPPSPSLFQPQPSRGRRSRSRRRLGWLKLLQLPQRPTHRLIDALVWLGLAVLGAFPVLSPGAIGLLALLAAIGAGLLVFAPKVGYLPIYRLVLVTLGLWLGGRL